MSVAESKRALRWEESKISVAAAGRCGCREPKEPCWEGTQESKPLGGTFWVNLSAKRIDSVLSAIERDPRVRDTLSHWMFAERHRGSPTERFFGGSPV